jgi:hypothetical protein
MAAYTIFNDTGEEYIAGFELLDGDFRKVLPVGFEFSPVTHSVRQPDGTRVKENEFYQGVRVEPTHLPTKVKWGARNANSRTFSVRTTSSSSAIDSARS